MSRTCLSARGNTAYHGIPLFCLRISTYESKCTRHRCIRTWYACTQACLQVDPARRPSAGDLMRLPYFSGVDSSFGSEFCRIQVLESEGCQGSLNNSQDASVNSIQGKQYECLVYDLICIHSFAHFGSCSTAAGEDAGQHRCAAAGCPATARQAQGSGRRR